MQTSSNSRAALNDFFLAVQAKALRQAEIACGNRDDGLDIVQEAMTRLATKYAQQPEDWGPLFQRILQNAIRDWFRRRKVRSWLTFSFADTNDAGEQGEDLALMQSTENPEHHLIGDRGLARVEAALRQLPLRQQQAFLLRAWWGADTQETAFAMKCSAGSVKTHYSRALSKLQTLLEDVP